jgi:hypothetical protein
MEYRPLGRTGVNVSELCLGTMMFGAWGNPDHDDSIRIIHHALDAGINFVDTADVYSAGESEEIVGKALKGRRDDVVLATKFWAPMGEGPNRGGVSRRWIITAVENSLRRLGTDWIDLYQVHRPDPAVDIEETLGALSDLVQQGKIRRSLAPIPVRLPASARDRKWFRDGRVTVLGRASLCSLALIAAGFCEPPAGSGGRGAPPAAAPQAPLTRPAGSGSSPGGGNGSEPGIGGSSGWRGSLRWGRGGLDRRQGRGTARRQPGLPRPAGACRAR